MRKHFNTYRRDQINKELTMENASHGNIYICEVAEQIFAKNISDNLMKYLLVSIQVQMQLLYEINHLRHQTRLSVLWVGNPQKWSTLYRNPCLYNAKIKHGRYETRPKRTKLDHDSAFVGFLFYLTSTRHINLRLSHLLGAETLITLPAKKIYNTRHSDKNRLRREKNSFSKLYFCQ